MADKKSKKADKGKGEKDKSSKAAGEADPKSLSLAAHPRAVLKVKQAKELGGLAGFLIGGYLALPTNTLADAALRALVAGIGCYVIVWAAAVFLWRRLVVAELRSRQHQMLAVELARLEGSLGSKTTPGPTERGRARTGAPS